MPALAAVAVAGSAQAQTYPAQNITFTVAFAAGGIADVVARLVGQKLGERLKHTVVVENRGGAGGNLAATTVAGASPDGYTILATTSAFAVNETASRNRGYTADDLRAVAIVALSPDVIAVHPSNPAKDLAEFIRNGRQKSFTYGSAGVGTGPHIGAEYFFKEVAKTQAVHVPFTGGAPAVQSAIGNHVDAIVLTLADGGAADQSGTVARHRARQRHPQHGGAERADLRRDGLSRRVFRLVGRLLRAGEDPGRDRREAQCRDQRDHERAGRAAEDQEHRLRSDPQVARGDTDYFKSEVAIWGKMVRAVGYSSE